MNIHDQRGGTEGDFPPPWRISKGTPPPIFQAKRGGRGREEKKKGKKKKKKGRKGGRKKREERITLKVASIPPSSLMILSYPHPWINQGGEYPCPLHGSTRGGNNLSPPWVNQGGE